MKKMLPVSSNVTAQEASGGSQHFSLCDHLCTFSAFHPGVLLMGGQIQDCFLLFCQNKEQHSWRWYRRNDKTPLQVFPFAILLFKVIVLSFLEYDYIHVRCQMKYEFMWFLSDSTLVRVSECAVIFTNILSWCTPTPTPTFEYQLHYIRMQGSRFCV